jgi:DNA-binding NarL/FixJ family response regulator
MLRESHLTDGVLKMADCSVISVGSLSRLLALRAALLHSAGRAVFTTTDPQEAAAAIESGSCRVLLICYSLPSEWRQRLLRVFRKHSPAGRVIAITDLPVVEPPKDVDEMIYGVDGPEVLIDAVRRKAA